MPSKQAARPVSEVKPVSEVVEQVEADETPDAAPEAPVNEVSTTQNFMVDVPVTGGFRPLEPVVDHGVQI